MPRDNIERAIKKGAGLLDETVNFETVTYEGFAPHRVPVIVECLTDNKNRTATNVRVLFRKGQLGAPGSVSWDFAHVGLVDATPPEGGADAEEAAIEAGAQDFEADGEGGLAVLHGADRSRRGEQGARPARGWTVATMRLGWRAKNPVRSTTPRRAPRSRRSSPSSTRTTTSSTSYVGYVLTTVTGAAARPLRRDAALKLRIGRRAADATRGDPRDRSDGAAAPQAGLAAARRRRRRGSLEAADRRSPTRGAPARGPPDRRAAAHRGAGARSERPAAHADVPLLRHLRAARGARAVAGASAAIRSRATLFWAGAGVISLANVGLVWLHGQAGALAAAAGRRAVDRRDRGGVPPTVYYFGPFSAVVMVHDARHHVHRARAQPVDARSVAGDLHRRAHLRSRFRSAPAGSPTSACCRASSRARGSSRSPRS